MSLRDSLYIADPHGDEFRVRFNASHPTFAGHFPGHPIVPGACLVQIAEELLASVLKKDVRTQTIRNLKFRKAITPDMVVYFTLTQHDNNDYIIDIHDEKDQYAQFAATYMCPNTNV